MARFMTRSVSGGMGEVLEATLEAAQELALETAALDAHNGVIRFRRPYGRRGDTRRLLVTITDNGRGGSTLHASWDDAFPARVSTRRVALQLFQRTRQLVA